ncbi:helix-turn-helix transcriptional regulator [uncultured Alsobacter sp.]|uniref:helix-turn-helix domain-containing protein n=1 Tax=uncultured Alsobacter sp. TaxID=1748258 RepID=UPI0025DDB629|nr:helix-turn-helix transcriptional regulator [uncultured Alsobacter sp.]
MTQTLARPSRTVGQHLRDWRTRRRLSQLHFALDAGISQRHLSFIESGRATPSRDMILRLADRLGVPLRERNAMVVAAGFAPVYPERPIGEPALKAARQAITSILKGHEPCPALAVDRHWHLVEANAGVGRLLALVKDPALLEPPVNVLRLALHPDGLAGAIINLAGWRHHVLERLRVQVEVTGDPELEALRAELAALPAPRSPDPDAVPHFGDVAATLRLRTPAGELSFITTVTVFGTPVDVTVSELALELFFPADDVTLDRLRALTP